MTATLPAVTGHLLSSAFIQATLATFDAPTEVDRVRRALVAWRTRCLVLGPASTPRTLLEAAAIPLCAALGLESPAAVEPANPGLAATLRANGRAGGAARDALGRGARSALAARGHAGS